MLPAGKYVVEVVVPPGYELVKEEDKNILIGDNYIAPVMQQFGGLGNIYILPDQAEIAANYNPNNALNSTTNLGDRSPSHEGDTGSVETFWPCVGEGAHGSRLHQPVPGSAGSAPFAGATRKLCDRKEVTLTDQTSALAKFYVFTSTHTAAHFTGVDHRRLHVGIRSVLAAVRREVRSGLPAGFAQGLGRQRSLPRLSPISGVPTTA